ncbi:ABC transporter substrate-binding protein [Streptomyces sp. MST-110588]|uniref:ABC transporter substrate-binding protein n=1 Tax=Streptomyces sp. MST-110588 TaxID=2833628 RepID=UPI001F5C244F|nr:ABC transporter substrate-binding protein [Streptomyces sp. MST-110588]UNO40122.1 ABC transporter family substrate-binding protein [Streptomyces sp. MST-110588]
MTDHDSPAGAAGRRRRRAALIAAGALLPLPVLAGCGPGSDAQTSGPVSQDIAGTPRDGLREGGTLRWAMDAMPGTLNVFQADADANTARVTGAVLPALFTLDARGTPQRNPDYLDAADVVERDPRQVVRYRINPKARWSDGRPIGVEDFAAQWNALRGKDNAYWTARNAGYNRIAKVERGAGPHEVEVTFGASYADWESLFTPLYPKSVMGRANAFNDGAREQLVADAGPFTLHGRDAARGTVTLVRNPKWWGERARLDRIVLAALPRGKRAAALADGSIDLAGVDAMAARRIAEARRPPPSGSPGSGSGNPGPQESGARGSRTRGSGTRPGAEGAGLGEGRRAAERDGLRRYTVRKALEPAYTQLAVNGGSGPLADERVRRAVARAIDRKALAASVLKPLGLPAEPLGSHLLMAGQEGYADHSAALGEQDTVAARALLADAGWRPVGGAQESPRTPRSPQASGGKADAQEAGRPGGGKGAHSDAAGARAEASADNREAAADQNAPDPGRAAGPAPLSAAVRSTAATQRAALLRQSAGLYRKAARKQKRRAHGDRDSTAYRKYVKYKRRAARAARAAVRIEAAQALGAPDTVSAVPAGARGAVPKPAAPKPAAPPPAAAGPAGPAGEGSPASRADAHAHRGGQQRHPAAAGAAARGARPAAVKKDGRPLVLRFVLPDGPGSEQVRAVGERISAMLEKIGVRTTVQKVADQSYFQDHISSGDYDLALYTWPGSAYPATDARPVYAKPRPAPDGLLTVEQNYTRVGTDHIDQLFDQAAAELDPDASRELVDRADARIWAAAGSIPLYQRPELVAAREGLANAGAFGFATPRYQDIGYRK